MSTVLEKIRETKNISKEEMACILGVTRQTYYKYESGEVDLGLRHVKKIAEAFNLNYSDIIDNKLSKDIEYNIIENADKKDNKTKEKVVKNDIRIDIPKENIEKFKQVLLYILKKVGSFPNVGETVIYKLLYFIDFDYYEINEEQLMGLKYIKNAFGPTPVSFSKLVKQFEKDKLIEEIKTKYFNYDMVKYLPLVNPDLSVLNAKEIKFIDEELEKYASKSAIELSDLSQKDIPWLGTKEKDVINYEAVFYRTEETSVRTYNKKNAIKEVK